jgi:hypothetical protein
MVKKVINNLLRISLIDRHVGVRLRLMRTPICGGFKRWVVDAKPTLLVVGACAAAALVPCVLSHLKWACHLSHTAAACSQLTMYRYKAIQPVVQGGSKGSASQ